jgi:TatD DNase family protein
MKNKNIYINIHSHNDFSHDDEFSIKNVFADNIEKAIKISNKKISIGLHPWYINSGNPKKDIITISKFAGHPSVSAIGEAGIDLYRDIPLKIQEKYFIEQIRIAEMADKPLIVHCVKAFNEIIRIRKNSKYSVPWIFHGFNANIQIARQVLMHNVYLSFGSSLLNPKSKSRIVFSEIPDDSFFLETDEADCSIEQIYKSAADIKKISTEKLKSIIMDNFNRCFQTDIRNLNPQN